MHAILRPNRVWMKGFLAAVLLSCLLLSTGFIKAENAQLTLSAPVRHRPYDAAEISLHIPQAGILSLYAQTGSEEMLILSPIEVKEGDLTLPFTGLTVLSEPLPRGEAQLKAGLVAGEKEYIATADLLIQTPAAGLMYALPSRTSLPRIGGEELYVDYQLAKDGYLVVSLYAREDLDNPLFAKTLNRTDTLPHSYRWDKKIKGQPAPAGDYVFTFMAQGAKQEPITFDLRLTEEEPETLALTPTKKGLFLPTALDDESVWAAMMAPIARVNIGAIAHQKVFEAPDSKSQSLGVIHGQTAGVLVLETGVAGFAKIRAARQGDGQWITGYIPQEKLSLISPQATHGLLIDKAAQTITLYQAGQKISTLKVSTGVYVPPGTSSFDTVPGAFLTQDRIAEFPSEGYRYLYAMRIDGGNLLHSTGYKLNLGARDFDNHQQRLGGMASHGCVRIDNRMNEEGINAWWLYANLPRNTKVLVLPENWAEEGVLLGLYEVNTPSLQEEAQAPLSTAPPIYQVEEEGEGGLPKSQVPDATLTLTFGGDCILGSEEQVRKQIDSFDSVVAEKGFNWPFSGLIDLLSRDDISLINLEGVLKNDASGLNPRVHNFRGPTAYAGILTLGSIEAVNIANNHFPDYGQEGKNSTRAALTQEGIGISGYSDLYVVEKNGIKLGFAGIRETIYKQNPRRMENEITELKNLGCEYIVYTCHFGNEYEVNHNQLQTQMAYAAIDAGANLVIGHHPHVVQGVEEYKGGLIFYSLGNLVFGGNLQLTTFDGLLAQVSPAFREGKLISTAVRLIPVLTSGAQPKNDFRPVVAQGADKARILSTIQADSAKPYEEFFTLNSQ